MELTAEEYALWYVALSIAAFDEDGYAVDRLDFMGEWMQQIEDCA